MIDATEKLLAGRLSVPGGRQVSGASRVSWIARFSQKRIFVPINGRIVLRQPIEDPAALVREKETGV